MVLSLKSKVLKRNWQYEHVRSREASQGIETERSILNHDGSIDLQCATGVRVHELRIRGRDATGCELSKKGFVATYLSSGKLALLNSDFMRRALELRDWK